MEPFRIEDRMEILDLIARCSYTFDGKDAKGFSELFTEDATWELHDHGSVAAEVVMHARSQLLEAAETVFAGGDVGVQHRHHQGNTLITEAAADSARGRTMFLVTSRRADEPVPRVPLSGLYEDEFVRTEAGWRFAKRVAHTGGPPPEL
jgi:ketosteroid isomerase-like protein